MHFDVLHALVSGILIFLTITGMKAAGLYTHPPDKKVHWSWPLFGAIFVVMLAFNLIWPAGP